MAVRCFADQAYDNQHGTALATPTAASRAAQRRPCRTVAAIIHATPIRRDAGGRYCLNDLHKAAGEEKRHQPAHFMALDTTRELAAEISNSRNPEIKPVEASRGRYGGTYVVEDLALTYAMWISPRFHLEVLRGFKESRPIYVSGVALDYVASTWS